MVPTAYCAYFLGIRVKNVYGGGWVCGIVHYLCFVFESGSRAGAPNLPGIQGPSKMPFPSERVFLLSFVEVCNPVITVCIGN